MRSTHPDLLSAALAYAHQGIPVFPCHPKDKRPLPPADRDRYSKPIVGTGGHHKASLDIDTIIGWWTKRPDALIGIPTGPVSGIDVLDLDVKNGKNGLEALPDWESLSPVIARTRSGGVHLYFKSNGTIRCTTSENGLDTRGAGGYVIGPPSPGYTWLKGPGICGLGPHGSVELPAWTERYRPEKAKLNGSGNGSDHYAEHISSEQREARNQEDIPVWLDAIPNNEVDWEYWNRIGMAIWGATNGSDEGLALFDKWSAKVGREYDANLVVARWEHWQSSSPPERIGAGALCHMAGMTPGQRQPAAGDEFGAVTVEKPCGLKYTKASTYTMTAIEWIWENRFAYGKLGLLGGLPDMGKGLITAFLIACVTAAKNEYPCGEGRPPRKGSVIYLQAEDAPDDTVIPRLTAAGADLDKVYIVEGVRVSRDKHKTFSLITDIDALSAMIDEIGDVAMIVIDPLASYVGSAKINTHMNSDVRSFLKPLTDMAAEKHVFVLGVVHFNKKTDVNSAMLRISDSLAYVAAARHVYVVVGDAEVEGRRLFAKAKNNLAPDSKALSYTTEAVKVGHDKTLGKDIWAPYVVWGTEHVKLTANEAMQAESSGGHNKHAKAIARDFLLDRLANSPVKVDELKADCKANSISWRTAERAKVALGIEARKDRTKFDGEWFWVLLEDNKGE